MAKKLMCMIVAEIGQTHEGSLGNALAFIDAVAAAGANAVKFQDHRGDSSNEWRPGVFHPQDIGRQAYWQRTTFKPEEWWRIRWHAHRRKIMYGVSCFSKYAAEQQAAMEPDFWKVPAKQSEWEVAPSSERLTVVSFLPHQGMPEPTEAWWPVVTTRQYPTPPDSAAFAAVQLPNCVGLSCHCPEIGPGIEAAKRGAKYLEYHVCFSRAQFGPDVSSSLTIEELAELVQEVRSCEPSA